MGRLGALRRWPHGYHAHHLNPRRPCRDDHDPRRRPPGAGRRPPPPARDHTEAEYEEYEEEGYAAASAGSRSRTRSRPPSRSRATGPAASDASRLDADPPRHGPRLPRRPRAPADDREQVDGGRAGERERRFAVLRNGSTIAIEIGDWPSGLYFARLTAPGRVGFAPFVVRAAAARRAPRRGRPPDPHLAGLQLPRRRRRRARRHLVRDAGPPAVPARPAVPEPRRPAALPQVRPALPALAAPDRPPRRRALAGRARRARPATGSQRAYDLIVFPGHHEYVTRGRVRRGRGLPRPRRQPDLPLGEQLLLADRPAREDDDARRRSGASSAAPRRASSASSTSATTWASTAARGSSRPDGGAAAGSSTASSSAHGNAVLRSRGSRSTRSPRARRAGRACWPRSRTCSAPGMTAHMTLLRDRRRGEGVRRRRLHARGLDPAVRRYSGCSPTSGHGWPTSADAPDGRVAAPDESVATPDYDSRPMRRLVLVAPRPRVRRPPRARPTSRSRRATSRRTKRLRIQVELPKPARVGVQLATQSGQPLGWIVEPQRRRFLTLRWNGRLAAQRVRDGSYLIRLVSGTRRLASSPLRIDRTHRGSPTPSPQRQPDAVPGRQRAADDDLPERRPAARRGQDPLHAQRAGARPLRGDAHGQRAADDLRADGEPPRRAATSSPGTRAKTIGARTYLVRITTTDAAGNRRTYGADNARDRPTPQVRRRARARRRRGLHQESYVASTAARLAIETDATELTLQPFRAGPEDTRTHSDTLMNGVPVEPDGDDPMERPPPTRDAQLRDRAPGRRASTSSS